jgi:hypothetical protein
VEEKKMEMAAITRIRNNRTGPVMRIMLGNQIQKQEEKLHKSNKVSPTLSSKILPRAE